MSVPPPCRALWQDHARTQAADPTPRSLSIVTDFAGHAVCNIGTARVRIVPFAEVSAEFAAGDGEGDGPLAFRRLAHEVFFERESRRIGRKPDPRMLVARERFEVVFLPAAAA